MPALHCEMPRLSVARPQMQDQVLQAMLMAWVTEAPQDAARFAELQMDPFLREAALRTVAQRWAQIDRDAAAHWALSLGDAAERDAVIDAVALSMGDSDPRAALDLLMRRVADERADSTRVGVISSWASRDFAAAQSWTEAQPPSAARDDIVLRLAFMRAQADPAAAMQLASRMLGDETARREAFASIIRPWIARDPDAARAWFSSTDAGTRSRIEVELAGQDEASLRSN